VKHRATVLVILVALYSALALADDFKTIGGKEYKDATVSHVEPDGIVLRTKSGISKVYFVELPKEVQERFRNDAEKAATLQRQREQAPRQQPAAAKSASTAAATPQNKVATSDQQLHRIGAVCRDGSESGATGRGACSRHGGVKCWKLSDGTCH
jgi:hypothetical protein